VSCLGDYAPDRFAWGDMGLSNVTQLAGSPASIGCARHGDGTVSCWGINRGACIGDPSLPHTEDYIQPTLVRTEDGRPLDGVTVVRPGIGMVCAVRMDGTLWCWGANSNGLLARGAAPYAARPVLARGL
jgi:alpha-tubulin suppressor-like RCC1 family protein